MEKETNLNMIKFGQVVIGNSKKLGLNPIESLICLSGLNETIGDIFLNELDEKAMNHKEIYKLSERLKIINNECKKWNIEKTKVCYLIQEIIGESNIDIEIGINELIPKSLKKRFDILKKDEFKCRYCGRCPPEVVLELEHIIPKSKGGDESIDNLGVSCRDCNRGKSNNLI